MDAVFAGKARRFNRRFEQMCSHYLIEPVACTPASGWEKGQVENQVGLVRERFFSPRLRVKMVTSELREHFSEGSVQRFMDGLLTEDVQSEAFKARLVSAFALRAGTWATCLKTWCCTTT